LIGKSQEAGAFGAPALHANVIAAAALQPRRLTGQ